jgi:hydroxymethylglutaryl-CoA lyase
VTLPCDATIVEVGPRDGLQNEPASIVTADKVEFVNRLGRAGLRVIEVGAFVSSRWVPQMADTDAVCAAIERRPDVRYQALVPNLAGLDRAEAAGLSQVAIFAAASETFSRRNINQSIEESLVTYAAVCTEAHRRGMRVRGYLSTCFGCPFEGHVPASRVATLVRALVDLGVFEVAVSDTIGVAHPSQVRAVLDDVQQMTPLDRVALHLHDTRGTALANVLAGLEAGVTTFDASCGGLGGCPYAPGAPGNLATEDLVHMLTGLGIQTDIDLEGLVAASAFMAERVDHPLPSRYSQAATGAGEAR